MDYNGPRMHAGIQEFIQTCSNITLKLLFGVSYRLR
jgi:hypothetical protein